MKRRRHTPEQIVRKLSDRLLGEGQELPQVVKLLEFLRRRITVGGRSTAG